MCVSTGRQLARSAQCGHPLRVVSVSISISKGKQTQLMHSKILAQGQADLSRRLSMLKSIQTQINTVLMLGDLGSTTGSASD